jgi:hypothetical protein
LREPIPEIAEAEHLLEAVGAQLPLVYLPSTSTRRTVAAVLAELDQPGVFGRTAKAGEVAVSEPGICHIFWVRVAGATTLPPNFSNNGGVRRLYSPMTSGSVISP